MKSEKEIRDCIESLELFCENKANQIDDLLEEK